MRARALAALTVASVLTVGVARQITTGARGMQASDEAVHDGNVRQAISGARAAAEALLPGSPYPRRGMERLAQIARDAETRGDEATAASAWRAMRAAALETRASWSNNGAWLPEANAGLTRAAAMDAPAPAPPPSGAALEAEPGPSSLELLAFGALPFALYAAATRFLRGARRKA